MVEKHPLGRNWSFSTIRDKNNQLSIRYAVHSAAPKGSIKKYLVFLNGRTEYIEKYSYLPKDFKLPKDFAFLTLDHRGQGASGGARGHTDSYESFIDDAKIVIDNVVKDTPYIMVCHSMGGLVGLLGHLNQTFSAKKLILSSPLLGLPDKPMPKPLSRPLSSIMTALNAGPISAHFGQNNKNTFSKNKLTHSFERYEKIQNAPYQIPSVTFGWVHATFQAMDEIFLPKAIKNLDTDVFIMGSPDDQVVDPSAWQKWVLKASQISNKHINFELIHGAKHELFSETPKFYDQAVSKVIREINTTDWT